ncbi:hypothetical protein [Janthinobacterium sp.]|uniref:hypothetical protein n=1 Tax=Janthinobacterium sp. TaxID=1871054 RepID=UPI00293D4079|nr:hypothetical protein [Janthinobacterium sp.]
MIFWLPTLPLQTPAGPAAVALALAGSDAARKEAHNSPCIKVGIFSYPEINQKVAIMPSAPPFLRLNRLMRNGKIPLSTCRTPMLRRPVPARRKDELSPGARVGIVFTLFEQTGDHHGTSQSNS